MSNEQVLEWQKLPLANGSRPRRPDFPGADKALYFRTHADAQAIFTRAQRGSRIAIIGGGLIGMELAAALTMGNTSVSVIEAAPVPLGRAVPKTFWRDYTSAMSLMA